MGNLMNRTEAALPELFELLSENRVSEQYYFTLVLADEIHFSFIYLKYNNLLSAFVLHPATTPICPIILSASAAVLFKGKHIGVNLPKNITILKYYYDRSMRGVILLMLLLRASSAISFAYFGWS